MTYETDPKTNETVVRFESGLVAGRIVTWPRASYFSPNSGVTFTAEQLLELSRRVRDKS
jgi:hypothetical protein